MIKKVSIIIPVYNVQDYLERCLNSIISQTYKNVEIILVDDGSTDDSGKICDQYKNKNENIIVIHKKNEGQSIARREGLEISTGEYISFVDADDFLNDSFYEKMIFLLEEFNCDIAICDYLKFSDNNLKVNLFNKENNSLKKQVLLPCDAIKEILQKDNKITNFLWNKVYKRHIFENIIFPNFNIYEDFAIMYRLMDNSKKIVYSSEKLYYYFDRKNSSSKGIPSKYIINKIRVKKEKKKFLLKKEYNLKNELDEYRFFSDYHNFKIIARNQNKNIFFGIIMKKELKFMKDFYKKNKNINFSLKELIFIKILLVNCKCFYSLLSLFKYK